MSDNGALQTTDGDRGYYLKVIDEVVSVDVDHLACLLVGEHHQPDVHRAVVLAFQQLHTENTGK